MTHKEIVEQALNKAMSYTQYRKLIDNLLADKKTTGENHSESMIHYTELNVNRMSKWDKRFKPSEEVLNAVGELDDEIWVLITEGWCGDAAHSVPVISSIAEKSPNIDLHFVLRDENLALMDLYLTNGGRSIPKLIRLNKQTLEPIADWGPRPDFAQNLVLTAKKEGRDYAKDVQIWYARNRGEDIERELMQSLIQKVL